MASLTGILLDVSGSMRRSIGTGTDEEGGPWARSIFEVIDNFVKHDVPSDNHVFAIGFGANCGVEMFDIIGTLKKIEKQRERIGQAEITEIIDQEPVTPTHIDLIFHKLEGVGAHSIRKWVTEEKFSRVVTDDMAVMLLNKFESDKSFLKKFVQEFLPPASRDWSESLPKGLPGHLYSAQSAAATVTSFKRATVEDIREVVSRVAPYLVDEKREKVEPKLLEEEKETVGVTRDSIVNVQEASDVLHGCFDGKELSKERSRELLKNVEPYIYGEKPLCQSIEKATELFQTKASMFSSHKKLLFILSDGEPTDGETTDRARIDRMVSNLTTAGVTVVSCSITDSASINPKRLFSKMEPDWDRGAKFLFSLSSKFSSQSLPRTMFVKPDWAIDITSNETHLFLQVNHPRNLQSACKLAEDVVFCKDTLSDVLSSVDVDIFHIQKDVVAHKAKEEQSRNSRHVNACATVLYLSMKRILSRKGGYPSFEELRKKCIHLRGIDFDDPLQILQEICPAYRLRCREVDLKNALEAVSSSEPRPVVASCWLTQQQWESFRKFFSDDSNRKRILKKKDIALTAPHPKTSTIGRSVLLTSFDSESLRLLNSWGEDWGDMGFFRVQNADVLGLKFIDVYWEKKDLAEEEKTYYEKNRSIVPRELMKLLASLKQAEYTCPMAECSKISRVMEFTGSLSRAKCPKCGKEFSTKNAQEENILALSIYLTSLIR